MRVRPCGKYRHIVILAADGKLPDDGAGRTARGPRDSKRDAVELTGAAGRTRRNITSVYLQPEALTVQRALQSKHRESSDKRCATANISWGMPNSVWSPLEPPRE